MFSEPGMKRVSNGHLPLTDMSKGQVFRLNMFVSVNAP